MNIEIPVEQISTIAMIREGKKKLPHLLCSSDKSSRGVAKKPMPGSYKRETIFALTR